ncbi:MAG: hypothetical protein GYA14_16795 [Ignavibacteria bacterium]|nr:hypothetical protein [Ignavibacteria bacterium]
MKKFIVLSFIILIFIVSCTPKKNVSNLLKGKLTVNSFPENTKIELLNQDKVVKLLILLHNRVGKDEILKELNIGEEDYSNIINRLFAEGLIKTVEGNEFIPACMVITSEDIKDIKNYVSTFGAEVAEIIIEKYSQAKEKYSQMNSFFNIPFEDASLFMLYSVMLDKWQVGNLVEIFLRSDIPQRGTNRSFVMIHQNDSAASTQKKVWLENKSEDLEDYQLCAFGNLSGKDNFIDINRDQLISDFMMREGSDEVAFKKKIIDDLIKFLGGNINAANPNLTFPLNKYGLLYNNQLLLPIISKKDNEILVETAKLVTGNLINYLDNKRPTFVKKYLSTVYKDETNFREWSFWIYKFIIEEAARILIDKGYVKPTERDLFYYLVLK